MRKAILIILTFLSLVLLVLRLGYSSFAQVLGPGRAGIRVDASQKSKVIVNHQQVGETPFQNEDFKAGEYLIELKSEQEATGSATQAFFWQGYVKKKLE